MNDTVVVRSDFGGSVRPFERKVTNAGLLLRGLVVDSKRSSDRR